LPSGSAGEAHEHRRTARGYLGLEVSDLGGWRRFATDLLGLAVGGRRSDGALPLRMDERAFRILRSEICHGPALAADPFHSNKIGSGFIGMPLHAVLLHVNPRHHSLARASLGGPNRRFPLRAGRNLRQSVSRCD